VPEWYPLAQRLSRAAHYWNCSVFELLAQDDPEWEEVGFNASVAEQQGQEIANEIGRKRGGLKNR